MDDPRQRVTEILRGLDLSDPQQADRLLAIVYAELRSLAARHLRGERRGHTLQPTALLRGDPGATTATGQSQFMHIQALTE